MKLGSNFALSFYSANAESTALRVGVGYQATSNSWHDSRLLNHNFSRLQVQTAVVVVNLEEQPRTNWRGGGVHKPLAAVHGSVSRSSRHINVTTAAV